MHPSEYSRVLPKQARHQGQREPSLPPHATPGEATLYLPCMARAPVEALQPDAPVLVQGPGLEPLKWLQHFRLGRRLVQAGFFAVGWGVDLAKGLHVELYTGVGDPGGRPGPARKAA